MAIKSNVFSAPSTVFSADLSKDAAAFIYLALQSVTGMAALTKPSPCSCFSGPGGRATTHLCLFNDALKAVLTFEAVKV